MQVIGCQLDMKWEDKPANFDLVRRMVEAVPRKTPSLVVLPEMFATGFSMRVGEIAEAAGGPTDAFVGELARERGAYVVAGIVGQEPDGRGRNESVVYDPSGRRVACYTKINPFSFGGETKHYISGSEVTIVDVEGWRMAPLVCYDLRFPEIFRRAAQRGADLMVVIANWPVVRIGHWTALLAARAIENQAYVVGINRTGRDPFHEYSGRSAIYDPHGRAIAELGDEAGIVTAELDLAGLRAYRKKFPALADLRPEFLAPLS
jgi:predicted amidohydrolase